MWSKFHSFITDSERLDAELNWVSKIWYLILVVSSSIYVFINFSELVSFTFFEEFNGKNLIFILWLVLLLLPLIDNFEGFGVHFSKHANRITQKSNEIAEEVMNKTPQNVEGLKKELEKATKEIAKKSNEIVEEVMNKTPKNVEGLKKKIEETTKKNLI